MDKMENRLPIIYVRGYAMTESERNETAADPFCGFNVGSTMYRATGRPSQEVDRFVFESPLVRLVTDFGYRHVYQDGCDILDPNWTPARDDAGNEIPGISPRSIVVYRYYDSGSAAFGDGQPRTIETYAEGLSALLERVQDLVCQWNDGSTPPVTPATFACYLVAHSMGGLVCRAMLQNPAHDPAAMRGKVAKLFTFATPHNGIDVEGFNVPSWLSMSEANTFSRDTMKDYLALGDVATANGGRVDYIVDSPASGTLAPGRVFCMVGSNRGDYEVGMGLVRAFVGHGSDGLVRIANASLWGVDDHCKPTLPCATAFAFRSHSGDYGIVNSEEAYQNLVRFLFGDVRVDIWLDIAQVRLPAALVGKADVTALYQFELLASPRGKRWYLTRRMSEEDSPACRTHQQLTAPADPFDNRMHLSTVFLSNKYRTAGKSDLQYSMWLGVRVPDYEIARKFWPDEHFEGQRLFDDTATVTLPAAADANGDWTVKVAWQNGTQPVTALLRRADLLAGRGSVAIPFGDASASPGIAGTVRLEVRPWN